MTMEELSMRVGATEATVEAMEAEGAVCVCVGGGGVGVR